MFSVASGALSESPLVEIPRNKALLPFFCFAFKMQLFKTHFFLLLAFEGSF